MPDPFYPVTGVQLPADLVCAPNGELQGHLLEVVGEAGRLHHVAARAWRALWAAGQLSGWDLTWTYGGCYRTLEQQRQLFFQRWSPIPLTGRPRAEYAGGSWWLKRGVARAAVPGTSNHGLGLAVDVALGVRPSAAAPIAPAVSWLLTVADLYGWSWESQDEPWHIRYVCGDQVPECVVEMELLLEAEQ